jgi:SAM-dependent methyltransferase
VRPTFTEAVDLRGDRPAAVAIDLGCGDGVETRKLLRRGWRVHAIDGAPDVEQRVRAGLEPASDAAGGTSDRLDVRALTFEEISELPSADLIYAGFALPFCDADRFPALWSIVREALSPGGVFAGEFFGPHDEWAGRPGMNFHDRAGVERLLDGLSIERLVEDDRPGRSFEGPKHWHVFHVVALQTR